jgi:hypothetical protein
MMGTLEAGILSGGGLGGTLHIGCWPPMPGGGLKLWDAGSTVYVYFDSQYFQNKVTQANDILLGIEGWARQTPKLIVYTYGGIVNLSCAAVQLPKGMTSTNTIGTPCNPHYPYLIVSQTTYPGNETVALSTDVEPVLSGKAAVTVVPADTIGGGGQFDTRNDREIYGVHEEGHRQGLGDCNAQTCPTPNYDETKTVMWGVHKSDQPTFPTSCDDIWASFYALI